jgi:hypothetical protein
MLNKINAAASRLRLLPVVRDQTRFVGIADAALDGIRRLDRDAIVLREFCRAGRARGRREAALDVAASRARVAAAADVFELVAAAVVVVLLAAADRGAAEDGEHFDQEEAEGGEAGAGRRVNLCFEFELHGTNLPHDSDADFDGAPH